MAVPVSWHIGSTPPAEMLAFFSSSSATYGRSRKLRVVEDVAQLLEMARAQQVGNVVEGRGREGGQRLRLDGEHVAAVEFRGADEVRGELAVGRRVLVAREHFLKLELGHASSLLATLSGRRFPAAAGARRLPTSFGNCRA
jgi:hypothetical protein